MPSVTDLRDKRRREIRRCKADFWYFVETYLKIVAKKADDGAPTFLIDFKPNRAQRRVVDSIVKKRRVYVLKARKLGISTIVAAYYFWRALFTRHFKVLVVAHKKVAAQEIFSIYTRFYDNLPKWMRFKVVAKSTTMLKFKHGGTVMCTTSSSDDARGGTPHALHLSEFAHYNDLTNSFAAIMNSVPDSAMVVRETTANGLNLAYRLWLEDDDFDKCFIPWTWDENYVSDVKIRGRQDERFRKYVKDHKLTKKQKQWAFWNWKAKQGGNWDLFNQENPITPEVAFITSGGRYFRTHYRGVLVTKENIRDHLGMKIRFKPKKHGLYIVGVDSANGDPNGRLSAAWVWDVTNKDKPVPAARYANWIPLSQFKYVVDELVEMYGALAVVETPHGTTITEYLAERGRDQYREVKFNVINGEKRWSEKMGFTTSTRTRDKLLSDFQELVDEGQLDVWDYLMKAQINGFVFKNGKPMHDDGEYDDLIFAAALGLQGLEQISSIEEERVRQKPGNVREMLQWELQTGRSYRQSEAEGFFGDEDQNDLLQTLNEIDELSFLEMM